MAKVLPSINCHTGDTGAVTARIRAIEAIFKKAGRPGWEQMAHFDVADGIFTFHKSWDEPEKLAEIKSLLAPDHIQKNIRMIFFYAPLDAREVARDIQGCAV